MIKIHSLIFCSRSVMVMGSTFETIEGEQLNFLTVHIAQDMNGNPFIIRKMPIFNTESDWTSVYDNICLLYTSDAADE